MKVFLPKAFRSDKTPSNKAFFDLTKFFQKQIDDGTLSIDSQNELPLQTGNSGKFLTTSGTAPSWSTVGTTGITNNAITDAKLRTSAAFSVIGRASNSTGNVADISGTDGQVLRVSGTTLGFGTVAITALPTNLQTYDGIKRYVALLTQSGTSAPTAVVLENTLSGVVVWTRNGAGDYSGTLASAFTADKTTVLTPNNNSITSRIYSGRVSANVIGIVTADDAGTPADDKLTSSLIEINVYPTL